MLIIFSGLPGTGKTTLARELARQLGATHLRIDSIEQAIRDCSANEVGLDEAGYRVAYAVAKDNLRVGRTVIADSVNPLEVTRRAWLEVGRRSGTKTTEIEFICSDSREHRARVETRTSDIPGLRPPTWEQVISREYDPWVRERVVIDTANRSIEQNIKTLREVISAQ